MFVNYALSVCFAVTLMVQCSPKNRTIERTPSAKMLWSDEFDYSGAPDATKWTYDLGDGCPHVCGWGNAEEQFYTDKPENVRVEDGHLVIEAHSAQIKNSNFTSARLVSKNRKDWKYGKIEVRAKLPQGKGTWPAVWMLPTDNIYGGWPKSGEIDIMEHVGYARDTVYGTIHTEAYNHSINTHKGGEVFVPDAESAFHLYTVNWTPQRIEWYLDNVQYFSVENENLTAAEWPFDENFHLLLNLAVGGHWGGKHGIDRTVFPQKMLVDYVRVYAADDKKTGNNKEATSDLPAASANENSGS